MDEDQRREPTKKPEERSQPDRPQPKRPPEVEEHPAPGIEHEPEPDAENIVPAKHRPGTL